jgi:GntR family transcriptional regulator
VYIDTIHFAERPPLPLIIQVDPNDARPIYRQVVDEIKGLVARGQLREGEPLPSVRQVAADLGVNLNTIATAYRELQDEGLITVRHGSGAVVRSRTTKEIARSELRKPLRTALTQLVLAGLPRTEIMRLIEGELKDLLKGAR